MLSRSPTCQWSAAGGADKQIAQVMCSRFCDTSRKILSGRVCGHAGARHSFNSISTLGMYQSWNCCRCLRNSTLSASSLALLELIETCIACGSAMVTCPFINQMVLTERSACAVHNRH